MVILSWGWAGFSFIHLLAMYITHLKPMSITLKLTHTRSHIRSETIPSLHTQPINVWPLLLTPSTPSNPMMRFYCTGRSSVSVRLPPFSHFPKTKNKPRLVLMKNFVHRIRIIKNKTKNKGKQKNQNEKPENSHMRTRRRAKLFKGCNFWTPNKNIRKCCMKINLVFLISLL